MPNQIQMSPTLAEIWQQARGEFKQKQKDYWQANPTSPSLSNALVLASVIDDIIFDRCTNIENWVNKNTKAGLFMV